MLQQVAHARGVLWRILGEERGRGMNRGIQWVARGVLVAGAIGIVACTTDTSEVGAPLTSGPNLSVLLGENEEEIFGRVLTTDTTASWWVSLTPADSLPDSGSTNMPVNFAGHYSSQHWGWFNTTPPS
jgi:hypothetical protein